MRRILAFAVLAACLAACTGLRTRTYQDNVVMSLAESSADSLFFDISLEYVTGGVNEEAKAAINSAIFQQAFDLETPDGTLEEIAARYRENLIDEYLSENSGVSEAAGVLTWEDRINGVFTKRQGDWENYLLSYYNYRGGAHGIQTLCQLVFNRHTGALLTENDLFAPDYRDGVTALLREAVRTEMEADDPELVPLLEVENIAPNGNFSVNTAGVQWVFQPYEVGPYALGLVMGTVSWEALKPYLK